jgi:hypothetical protein
MLDGTEHENLPDQKATTEGERDCETTWSVKMWRGEQKNTYKSSKFAN